MMCPQQLDIYGQTKIEEAVAFIRHHEPEEGYFLGFSGGKDSQVLYALAEEAGVKFEAYYSVLGVDPPELTRFIRRNYPRVKWCFPETHFFRRIPIKGYPSIWRRWCCDELKKNPTKDIPLDHRLMGIRKEESKKRAARLRVDRLERFYIYKPLFYFLEWEIWDFLESNKIEYCKLYDMGFDRLGCCVCPFLCDSYPKLNQAKKQWPGYYRAFEKAMRRLWDSNREMVKNSRANTFEEFLQFWYSAGKIKPKKKEGGLFNDE